MKRTDSLREPARANRHDQRTCRPQRRTREKPGVVRGRANQVVAAIVGWSYYEITRAERLER